MRTIAALIFGATIVWATVADAHARHARHHHHHAVRVAAAIATAPAPFFFFQPMFVQQPPAEVRVKHHVARSVARSAAGVVRGGLVTVQTAAGKTITVAASLAGQFQSLIQEFVAHGYMPRRIGSFATHGHVPGSRHYAGAALDFDQCGFGCTVSFMRHARQMIVAHGLRDGCDFGDCGHVDDGASVGHHRRRYASR